MKPMAPEAKFFQNSSDTDLWQRYCGFMDLSMDAYMEIRGYMSLEQVKLVAGAPLASKIMGGSQPDSVKMFRSVVPITTYDDYADFIGAGPDGALGNGALGNGALGNGALGNGALGNGALGNGALGNGALGNGALGNGALGNGSSGSGPAGIGESCETPYFWCHSAGRGGNVKWIPYTQRAFDRIAKYGVAVAILSAAEKRGDISPEPGDKVLVKLAPRPYASGTFMAHLMEYFPYHSLPPLDDAESMEFGERTKLAFEQGLSQGIDYIFSVSTVLAKIAEKFSGEEHNFKLSSAILQSKVFRRLAWAWLRGKRGRRQMMPRDLWSLKVLVTLGVDTPALEEKLAAMWGKVPYQVYGTTEMMISGVQGWNKKGMTLPDMAFWEFIPDDPWERLRDDPTFQPATILMDELEVGQQYELVYRHFHDLATPGYLPGVAHPRAVAVQQQRQEHPGTVGLKALTYPAPLKDGAEVQLAHNLF